MKICIVDNCDRPVIARMLCVKHYQRLMKYGTTDDKETICSVIGCENKIKSRGWCSKHYYRWLKWGDVNFYPIRSLPLIDRFWDKVDKKSNEECWEWKGKRARQGYGRIFDHGKELGASRVSYELHFGKIEDGLYVLHKCDNPPCVNPGHLFLGTNTDNMQDMVKKGRGVRFLGSTNPSSKLTENQVIEIIQRRNEGETLKAIGDDFGIAFQSVSRIIHGDRWGHLTKNLVNTEKRSVV